MEIEALDRRQGAEEAPGFAVLFEAAAAAGAVGIDPEAAAAGEGAGGHDAPSVLGNDIADDEIHLGAAVGDLAERRAALGADAVGAALPMPNGFDLDAAEAATGVEEEVVAGGVAVDAGDAQAEGEGAGHELELGPFAFGLR